MKVGEIWKLQYDQSQSPLVGLKNGKIVGLVAELADHYIFLPAKVKIITLSSNILVNEEPNNIGIQPHPEGREVWYFSREEFISCYEKDWDIK